MHTMFDHTVHFSYIMNRHKLTELCSEGELDATAIKLILSDIAEKSHWQKFFEAINKNPKTFSLGIQDGHINNNLDDAFFESLRDMLKTNSTIKHFHLYQHKFTSNQIALLATGLSTNTTLHTLELQACQLNDTEFQALLTDIGNNTTLQTCFYLKTILPTLL